MKIKAVVLEVREKTCIVLTADGSFREVKAKGKSQPGQEITLPETGWRFNKYALAAACLVFFIVTAGFLNFSMAPAVAAYVCLDINPSVELAIDKDNIVRKAEALNDDGRELLTGLQLKGAGVGDALEKLIEVAVEKKYIQPGEENVIMSSVVPAGSEEISEVDTVVKDRIEAFLQKKNIKAEVVVGKATSEVRAEAEKSGMSTGRYMLYMKARENDAQITPGDFRGKSIRQIEKDRKIKFKEIYKTGEQDGEKPNQEGKVPPGQQKKDRDAENSVDWGRSQYDSSDSNTQAGQSNGEKDKDKNPDKPGNGWGPGGSKQQDPGRQDNDSGGKQSKDNKDDGGKDKVTQPVKGDEDKGNDRGDGGNKGQGSSGNAISGGNGGSSSSGSSSSSSNGGSSGSPVGKGNSGNNGSEKGGGKD
ncbi:MAG: anti-sigma-I factor RsgI family protein [Bacillota bacterium]